MSEVLGSSKDVKPEDCTPAEIDVYTLRKDVLNYVRRIRLKEYFYSDEETDGDFSEIPAFRKKSS